MVQHHAISFKVKRPRQDHRARVGGVYGSAGAHAEIKPLMLAPGLAVVDPRSPKNAGSLGLGRPLKFA